MDQNPSEPSGAGRLVDMFAGMAEQAYLKAGRGTLDAVGLKGTDIKGFAGAPRDATGAEMSGSDLQQAVADAPAGGLSRVLGQGFEERSFEVARRVGLGGQRIERPGRDGRSLGE